MKKDANGAYKEYELVFDKTVNELTETFELNKIQKRILIGHLVDLKVAIENKDAFAENQYPIEEGRYMVKVHPQINVSCENAKEAKLIDSLCEILDYEKEKDMIFSISRLVDAYQKKQLKPNL